MRDRSFRRVMLVRLPFRPVAAANDNALAEYLESDCAQHADLRSLLAAARLVRCTDVPLTAEQLQALQRVLEERK